MYGKILFFPPYTAPCRTTTPPTSFSKSRSVSSGPRGSSLRHGATSRRQCHADLLADTYAQDRLRRRGRHLKIVDFSPAKKLGGGRTRTPCGTTNYLAPEVVLSEDRDWDVDYWALGVPVYKMTAGRRSSGPRIPDPGGPRQRPSTLWSRPGREAAQDPPDQAPLPDQGGRRRGPQAKVILGLRLELAVDSGLRVLHDRTWTFRNHATTSPHTS